MDGNGKLRPTIRKGCVLEVRGEIISLDHNILPGIKKDKYYSVVHKSRVVKVMGKRNKGESIINIPSKKKEDTKCNSIW